MPKFIRATPKHPQKRTDLTGTVAILVKLVDKHGTNVKGNLCRQVSIKESKVSEVFSAIERLID